MANYANIKATINAQIRQNGNEEITGPVLNSVLNAMVGSLGKGFTYMGLATPSTNPGTPDENVYYLADTGEYPYFNGAVVPSGMYGVFRYNGTWTTELVSVGKYPEREEVIMSQLVMPTSSIVRQFLEVYMEAGRRYHFKIEPNGYVPGTGNYSYVVSLYENVGDSTAVATPLSMSRAEYGGEVIEFDYNAAVTTRKIRIYIAAASTVGSGTVVTITSPTLDNSVIENVISSENNVELPYELEQGSLLADGNKQVELVTTRVRTRNLIKLFGKTRISIGANLQFASAYYSENDWGTEESGVTYRSSPLEITHYGYLGLVIKRPNGSALLPHEVTGLKIESVPVLTQIQEQLTTQRSVKDYGAVGDGVTDDSSAITAAVAEGGTVYFPDGVYLVNTAIPLLSNTELILSPGATVLRGANIKALFYTDWSETTTGYGGVQNLVIRGGCLDMGTGFSQGGFPVGLIHASNIRIQDVTFRRANAGYHSIDACGVRNLVIRGCVFDNVSTTSIYGECVQIDNALQYSHFPIKYDGEYACWDGTPCENVEVCGCRFVLNNYSPAVGNHNIGENKYIDIHDNLIIGNGSSVNTRGAVVFGPSSTGDNRTTFVQIHDNTIVDTSIGFQVETEGVVIVKNNLLVNVTTLKTEDSGGIFESNITR